jgi:hypothetical protein
VLLNADPGRAGASAAMTGPVIGSVDSVRGRSKHLGLLRSAETDSLGRPKVQCPMPVARPDPAAAESMPTGRTARPGRGVWWFTGPAETASGMPVIKSGCWNPLDQPRGNGDSLWIGRQPSPRR